jgi:hypothetical protein
MSEQVPERTVVLSWVDAVAILDAARLLFSLALDAESSAFWPAGLEAAMDAAVRPLERLARSAVDEGGT